MLNYLSRYVFRTAISNARILAVDQTHVTFRCKDRAADTWRTMRLDGPDSPCCPYCGSHRTSLLAQWPSFGEP